MAASATFGRAGSADTWYGEPTHRGEERKHAWRDDGGGDDGGGGGGGGGSGPKLPPPIDWEAFDRARRAWERTPTAS